MFLCSSMEKNILYYYIKLNELFFDEDLHNIINNLNAAQLNRPSKNAQEKISLAPALNMWFIKGWYPGPQNINHIERQLVSILKKEIELDYDKSIQRILFIKEFLRCVKKQ